MAVRYKVASLIFGIATFLFVTGAMAEAQEVADLGRRGEIIEAVVTLGPGARTSTIEVELRTPAGRTVRARTTRYSSEVERGDRLRMEYDPLRPDRVQEAGWGKDYTAVVGFGLAGLMLAALTCGCVLRRWPRRIERPLFAVSTRSASPHGP